MPHPKFEAVLNGADQPLLGGWITAGSEPIVEATFGVPYDYVGIDTQHTLIDVATAGRLLYAVPKDGPAAIVRVPGNNAWDINKAIDAGADGVIVPMVNSAAEARQAVAATRFAPDGGVRSFGPMRNGMPFDVAGLTARVAVFAMVETVEAVANVEEICATPGLTGIYVGPADLAITMGLRVGLNPFPDAMLGALSKIGAACKKNGLIAGGHLPVHYIPALRPLGFKMFTIGVDRGYIAVGGRADVNAGREAFGSAAKAS
jgi:2-keto-3-deoxy-L-rhamnonate aldolase RhmA